MKTDMKLPLIAAGIVGLSAVPAVAAVVTNDLNLRRGPGTNYNVITAMPAGARVDIDGCSGNWCQVDWRGYSGYASASYLAGEGRTVRRARPRYRYSYGYPDYWDRDRWRYGYWDRRPGFSIRLGAGRGFGRYGWW